jgi:hypothetical protein
VEGGVDAEHGGPRGPAPRTFRPRCETSQTSALTIRNIWGKNLQIWRNSAKRPQQNDTPTLRSWRASLFRKRGTRFLGHANAPDREAAKIAAVEWFKLDDEQRHRLVVQERA